jgi:hypothetical protein
MDCTLSVLRECVAADPAEDGRVHRADALLSAREGVVRSAKWTKILKNFLLDVLRKNSARSSLPRPGNGRKISWFYDILKSSQAIGFCVDCDFSGSLFDGGRVRAESDGPDTASMGNSPPRGALPKPSTPWPQVFNLC